MKSFIANSFSYSSYLDYFVGGDRFYSNYESDVSSNKVSASFLESCRIGFNSLDPNFLIILVLFLSSLERMSRDRLLVEVIIALLVGDIADASILVELVKSWQRW